MQMTLNRLVQRLPVSLKEFQNVCSSHSAVCPEVKKVSKAEMKERRFSVEPA